MWLPPWRTQSALFGLGATREPAVRRPTPKSDIDLARRLSALVRENKAAGRPFYANVPPEYTLRFQQNAKGIYNFLRFHKYYAIRALTQEQRDDLALRIVNKTYYNALRGMDGYSGQSPLTSWFYIIARNALIDELRMYIRSPAGRARMITQSLTEESEGERRSAVSKIDEASIAKFAEEGGIEEKLAENIAEDIVEMVKTYIRARNPDGSLIITGRDALLLRTILDTRGSMALTALARVMS